MELESRWWRCVSQPEKIFCCPPLKDRHVKKPLSTSCTQMMQRTIGNTCVTKGRLAWYIIKASDTQLVGLSDFSSVFHNAFALIWALTSLDIFMTSLHKYSSCSCTAHAIQNSSGVEKGRDSDLMQHLSQRTWSGIIYLLQRCAALVLGLGSFWFLCDRCDCFWFFCFLRVFLNCLQENSEGFLSRAQPTVKYHSTSWLTSVVPEVRPGVPHSLHLLFEESSWRAVVQWRERRKIRIYRNMSLWVEWKVQEWMHLLLSRG